MDIKSHSFNLFCTEISLLEKFPSRLNLVLRFALTTSRCRLYVFALNGVKLCGKNWPTVRHTWSSLVDAQNKLFLSFLNCINIEKAKKLF